MPFGEDTQQEETFLDVETENSVEPRAEPAGEYKIKIVSAEISIDKNRHPYFLPRFEVIGKPYSKDFTKFHGLPHDDLTEKDLNATRNSLDKFKKCFGLSEGKLSLPGMIGLEGWAILGAKDDPEWGEQNFVRKYVLPK